MSQPPQSARESAAEIWCTAVAQGTRHDLAVMAPVTAPSGVVLDEIAQHLGGSPGVPVRVARTGAVLNPELSWGATVLHGDVLEFGAQAAGSPARRPRSRKKSVELVVTGGPASGERFELASGPHVLGRAPDVDLPVRDTSVSRAHVRFDVDGGTVRITDLESSNGTFVDGQPVTGSTVVEPGQVIEAGSSILMIEQPSGSDDAGAERASNGRVPVNRPPRLEAPYRPPVLSLPAPPAEPTSRRFPIGTAVIPLILGLVLYTLTRHPATLLFALLSPAMAVYSLIDEKRSGRKKFRSESADFRERVATTAAQVTEERRREADARRSSHPDLAVLTRRVTDRADQLWERRPEDPDFLEVRVGSADQPSAVAVTMPAGGSDALRAEAEAALTKSSTITSLPVALGLAQDAPLGLWGTRDVTVPLARALVAQIAAMHTPNDVVVSVAAAEDRRNEWQWSMWLPHCRDDRPGFSFPLLAAGSDDIDKLVERLEGAVTARTGADKTPYVVVVVDAAGTTDLATWGKLLEAGPDRGCAVIWIADRLRDLPNQCRAVVECDPDVGQLSVPGRQRVQGNIVLDGMTVEAAERLARALAPLVDVTGARAQAIPRQVGLLDTLQVPRDAAADIERRWAEAPFAARAVVGRSANGPVSLDLDRDGPHALVAGTTQSGKSELLQTWVTSLAAAHPPEQLVFLLIDFKGEAGSREVARLPHTVGVVTDLDPGLASRALASLNAEVRRRERLFREAGVSRLKDLAGARPDLATPKLVIVIDEFAVLKQELPDFIDGIVNIAQVGASMGIHVILATQKPEGVVDPKIRANVNLRVCLRVVSPQDSENVLGTGVRDAARLTPEQRGRALINTGSGAPMEVQIAYGGDVAAQQDDQPRVTVRPLSFGAVSHVASAARAGAKEVVVVVDGVRAAAERTGRTAPPAPWLPPLPTLLRIADLPTSDVEHRAVVGLVDRPAEQRQDPLLLDLEADGSVAIFGAANTGKSTVLRTVAASLASVASPDELHLYGLDFGSGGLSGLEALPHCGAVVPGADDERVRRLLRSLRGTVASRRQLLLGSGASSLSEYRSRTGEVMPRIVLLLDDYGGLVSTYERVDFGDMLEAVPRLVAEGSPVGVHVVLTADRRGSLPTALLGMITRRLVLRLASPDEYAALGVGYGMVAGFARSAGRALIDGAEAQIAIVGNEPGAGAQLDALTLLGSQLRSRYPASVVPGVSTLPTTVRVEDLAPARAPLVVPIAMGDNNLDAAELDLSDGHFLVTGPHRSGRTTTLATIARQLGSTTTPPELVLLSPRRSALPAQFAFSRQAIGDECADFAAALAAEVELRRDDGSDRPLVVLADDLEELQDTPASAALERLARRGRDRQVRVVGACEAGAARAAFGGVVRELRKSKRGVLLMPDVELDGDLVGVRLPRQKSIRFVPGRGYLVDRGLVELVQVATLS